MAAMFASLLAGEALVPAAAAATGVLAAAGFVLSGAGNPSPPTASASAHARRERDGSSNDAGASEDAAVAGGARRQRSVVGGIGSAPAGAPADGGASAGAQPSSAEAGETASRRAAAGCGDRASAGGDDDAGGGGAAAPRGAAAEEDDEEAEARLLQRVGLGRRKLTPQQEQQIKKGIANLPEAQRKALEEWINMKEESVWPMLAMNLLVLTLIAGIFICFSAYLIIQHQINIYDWETWRQAAKIAEGLLRKYRILRPFPAASVAASRTSSITAEL